MPSSMITVDVQGIEELIARFRAGEAMVQAEMILAMADSVAIVKKDAQEYPPESEANQPPPPYYIRGTGTQLATRNRYESEHLKDHWQTNVQVESRGVRGKIFNFMTSYAPWVHGIRTQAIFHAARGWRIIAEILNDNLYAIESRFQRAGQRVAKFLNGGAP